MSSGHAGLPRTFRLSGICLLLGLLVEGVSLRWVHPLAFIGFIVVGGALLGAGIVLFLYSLLTMGSTDARNAGSD